MNKCHHFQECPFFNNKMKNMPTLTRQLQEKYCLDESDKCARYIVNQKFIEGYTPKDDNAAIEIERSFDSLYPSNTDKAEEIISQLVIE